MQKKSLIAYMVIMAFLPISVNACSIFKPWTYFQKESKVVGSGALATKTVAIPGIQNVTVQGVGNCVIVQDKNATELVVIEAEENILSHIEIVYEQGFLTISLAEGVQITTKHEISYTITVKDISKITGLVRLSCI